MRRLAAVVAALIAIAGCIRVVVTIGGRDAATKQAVDVEPSIGVHQDIAKKGQPEGDLR